MMRQPFAAHFVLRCDAGRTFDVLQPFEAKGFDLVGLKTHEDISWIALRSEAPGAATQVTAMSHKLDRTGSWLFVSTTQEEALSLLHAHFSVPRELVQWDADNGCDAGIPFGDHFNNCSCFWVRDLLAGSDRAAALGARFCEQLRRDSYVPLLLPAPEAELLRLIEENAAMWFAEDEDEKLSQAVARTPRGRPARGRCCLLP